MVFFNYATKEITAKIVYYGPGLCGKTTNLEYIHANVPEHSHGKFISLATKTDRTLFFDLLPVELGTIRGMKTRLQLYTVPGQVFYNSTRKLVLKGVDGVVFVADSQEQLLEANFESFQNLKTNLQEYGLRLQDVAVVIQFNKRDLPNILAVELLNEKINEMNAPIFEAVATTGIGVQETLRGITKLVLNKLAEQQRSDAAARATPSRSADLSRGASAVSDGLVSKGRAPAPRPSTVPIPSKATTPTRLPTPVPPPPLPRAPVTPPRAFPAAATRAIPIAPAPAPEPPRASPPKFDFQDEELDSFLNAGLAADDFGDSGGEPTVHITAETVREATRGRAEAPALLAPSERRMPTPARLAPVDAAPQHQVASLKPAAGQSVWDMWKSGASARPASSLPPLDVSLSPGHESVEPPVNAGGLSDLDDPFGAVDGVDPFAADDPFASEPAFATGDSIVPETMGFSLEGDDDPFGDVSDPFAEAPPAVVEPQAFAEPFEEPDEAVEQEALEEDAQAPFELPDDLPQERKAPRALDAVAASQTVAEDAPSVRGLASLHPDDWIAALSPEAPPLAPQAEPVPAIDNTAALPASARPKRESFKDKVTRRLGDEVEKEEKIDFRAMLQDELDKEGDPFFSPHLGPEAIHEDPTVSLSGGFSLAVELSEQAEQSAEMTVQPEGGVGIDVPSEPAPVEGVAEQVVAAIVEERVADPVAESGLTKRADLVDPFELEVTEHLKALAARKATRVDEPEPVLEGLGPSGEPPPIVAEPAPVVPLVSPAKIGASERKVEREIELLDVGAGAQEDVELEVELAPSASSVNPKASRSGSAWEEPVSRTLPPAPDTAFEVVREVEVPLTLSVPEGADRIVLRLSLRIELKRQ